MKQFYELQNQILPILLPWVKRIEIFGSVARGDDRFGSDVDVLVKLKPPSERPHLGLFKWIDLENELSDKLGRKVDLVSDDALSPYIRPYVDQEKVVLYEE